MARLLLKVDHEMTDKNMPETPEHHDGASTGGAGNAASDGSGTTAGGASPPAGTPIVGQSSAALKQANPPRRPLITAIEIENFKGIGAPIRIDLRPITLLFGRNSAGKSTIIQALCYAHEILSNRNVDVHKTELGGDQMDLGGFRQFVHRHETERTIRLRFELDLQDWKVPEPVWTAMNERAHDPYDTVYRAWLDDNDPANAVRSGWVTLAISQTSAVGQPAITNYEVGINDVLVGRTFTSDPGRPALALNRNHPLLDRFDLDATWSPHVVAGHVAESADSQPADWQLLTAPMAGGRQTLLPNWDSTIRLSTGDSELKWAMNEETSLRQLEVFISGLLVGIGRTLRDELAGLRYLGPIRQLHPQTNAEYDVHSQGHWSDGSAAWHRLLHYDRLWEVFGELRNDLLADVNEWLSDPERLDTAYELRQRSILELTADQPAVNVIRNYEQVFGKHRSDAGDVDTERMIAEKMQTLSGPLWDDQSLARMRKHFKSLAAAYGALQNGRALPGIRDLFGAIATAPEQKTLDIVDAKTGVRVRTSDIGVGISQILPVVVAALDAERPGITAIEQPELHVHPKMQVELGDLFAQGVDHERIFLVETHSEHLILRLLRRIEETHSGELPEGKPPLKPDQVSVVFLEQQDGEMRVTRLRIDETGEFIDRWPQGFFRERAAELF